MNQQRLSNTNTPAQSFIYILVTVMLTLSSFQNLWASESEDPTPGARGKDAARVDAAATMCTAETERLNQRRDDFRKACSKAELGSPTTCREKLEACDGLTKEDLDLSDPETKHCFVHRTIESEEKRISNIKDEVTRHEERADKGRDRADQLRGDLEDVLAEINELVSERDNAEAELQGALAGVNSRVTETYQQAQRDQDRIRTELDNLYDSLADLYLDLQNFTLENKLQCRQQAVQIANQYVQRERGLAAQGHNARMDQFAFLSMGGRGIRNVADRRHDRALRSCTSLYDPYNNGKITAFGDQYLMRKARINNEKRKIIRTANRLQIQKQTVEDTKNAMLAQLEGEKQRAVSNAIRAKQRIDQRATQLQQKLASIRARQVKEEIQLIDAENKLAQAETTLRRAENELNSDITNGVARDNESKTAFQEALALADEVLDLEDAEASSSRACVIALGEPTDARVPADDGTVTIR